MTRPPELSPEKIYHAMDRQRRIQRISWRGVAREVGLPPGAGNNAITRLGRGRFPTVYNLTLILLWLGKTDLREFLKDQAQ